MKRLIIFVILILIMLLTGCNRNIWEMPVKENKEALMRFNNPVEYSYDLGHYPLTIENVNSKGELEKQTFYKPPERVISVWQNSIETLLALGVGDRIVAGNGVPKASYFLKEYQEQYKQIPYTGIQLLDLETSMMLEPDLIVGWHSTFSAKVLRGTDFWHKRGVNTFISANSVINMRNGRKMRAEFEDILTLGKIFDKNERAQEIVESMQREIDFVKENTVNRKQKTRALIIEYLGKECNVYNSKSLAGDIVKELDGELLSSMEKTIGAERIIELDPDVIFVVVTEWYYGQEDKIIEKVTKHKALSHLRCVANKRVIPLPLYSIYSSGVRTYDGIKIISKGLYPELYNK